MTVKVVTLEDTRATFSKFRDKIEEKIEIEYKEGFSMVGISHAYSPNDGYTTIIVLQRKD